MKLSEFDYELPKDLIAQFPAERRDESRLIVLDRAGGDIRETRFANFPRFLQEGDLLVVNETRVIPARILGRKKSGGLVEVFLVRRLAERQWIAMLRPASRLRAGESVLVGERDLEIAIGERVGRGGVEGEPPRLDRREQVHRGVRARAAPAVHQARRRAARPRTLPDRSTPGATAPSRRRRRGSISRRRRCSTPRGAA